MDRVGGEGGANLPSFSLAHFPNQTAKRAGYTCVCEKNDRRGRQEFPFSWPVSAAVARTVVANICIALVKYQTVF